MSKTSNQYYQILTTYWRRPLVLLLAFLFLICFANLAFMPKSNRTSDIYPEPEHTGKLHFVYTSENQVHAEGGALDQNHTFDELLETTKATSIRSLCVVQIRNEDPFPDIRKTPNLSYLKISGIDLNEEIAAQILQLPKLQALELTSQKVPPRALERIGQHVPQIQLRSLCLEEHLDELPAMSAVRSLTVEYQTLSPGLIEAIATIPHLEKLAFVPRGRHQGSANALVLTPTMQDSLRTHPTLKDVYADWSQMKRHHQFNEESLLPLRTFPLQYSSEKFGAIGGGCFAILVLIALIVTQLWAQFIVPAAAVVPNYLQPHRRVAVALLCCGSLLIWLALLRYGFDLLASLSVVLMTCGIIGLYLSMFMILDQIIKKWISRLIDILCFTTPWLAVMMFPSYSSEVIWFIEGHMPGVAIAVSSLSLVTVVLGFRQLSTMTNHVNEKFSSLPVFSPWETSRTNSLEGQQYNNWLIRLLDRGYQQLEYRSRTTLQMTSLWRKGNLLRPIYILFFMVLVLLFCVLPLSLMRLTAGEPIFPDGLERWAGVFAAPFGMGIVLPMIGWSPRLKSLESESLKPLCRSSLCKQLYLSLAFDHWLIWSCMFVFLGHRMLEAPGEWLELGGLAILFGVAAPLWMIGVSSCVLIFKRAWVILASMIGLYSLIALGLGIAAAFGALAVPGSPLDMQLLYLFAIIALTAAIALNFIMYRALLKREWG